MNSEQNLKLINVVWLVSVQIHIQNAYYVRLKQFMITVLDVKRKLKNVLIVMLKEIWVFLFLKDELILKHAQDVETWRRWNIIIIVCMESEYIFVRNVNGL
jgi:hypothetical protein